MIACDCAVGFRILVCGGRTFSDRAGLWQRLDFIDRVRCIDLIIEGEAPGADTLAREWAQDRGVPFWGFPAPWDEIDHLEARVRRDRRGRPYDANAGPRRNQQMLDEGCPTHILAAPGGTGTADMVVRAGAAGLIEIPWDLA